MLGSSCSPCCTPSELCSCGDITKTYEQQTAYVFSAGRWCCSGSKPSEVTIRLSATSVATSFLSYQALSGGYYSGYFYDAARGYYLKRYKRTLTIDMSSVNADYALASRIVPTQLGFVRQCAYAFGRFNYPRIFAGSGIAESPGDSQNYPSYTLSFMTGNSSVVGMSDTTGTIRREYEYMPVRYIGFSQFESTGGWTRDASLDTESSALSCTYNWATTYRSVLDAQACDIRPLGLSWGSTITVDPDVYVSGGALSGEGVRESSRSAPINGGPMVPQFSLVVEVLPA
jgi:hypothetical protein